MIIFISSIGPELVIKLMKKQILHKSIMLCVALFVGACDFLEDEKTEQEQSINYTNTLGQDLGGTQGAVADYF